MRSTPAARTARRFAALCMAFMLHGPALAADTDRLTPDGPVPTRRADVIRLAEKVADTQVAALAAGLLPPKASWDTPKPDGWVQATLFIGLTALADRSAEPRFKQVVLARGHANGWKLGKWLPFADDHAIGQAYLWAAKHGAGPEALAPMRAQFDQLLANPPTVDLKYLEEHERNGGTGCLERWCWSDALFMSPPTWFGLAKQTGDRRYADFAARELWATTDYLYDRSEQLFFRDSRFFERRNAAGRKLFWSRGNGWVLAGLARMLPLLPESSPDRARMLALFQQMAGKLRTLQKPDGTWSPSLLDDVADSRPETSGTAFFVFAMATGMKQGRLPRATYEPVVRKGWSALVHALHPDGRLGWVQPVSDRPEQVSREDSQFYGTGAFLLAAAAMADLNLPSQPTPRRRLPQRH